MSAMRTSFQGETVTGGMNRRFFTGGAANGIPKHSRVSSLTGGDSHVGHEPEVLQSSPGHSGPSPS
jgi:hypothetical protein